MELTSKAFWLDYWESHKNDVLVKVPEQNLFTPIFVQLFKKYPIKTTCELGGFPGSFSVYLKKKYQTESTLVDYVIHSGIMEEFLKTNDLKSSDLKVIEADVFQYEPQEKYDLVYSIGLIEHFENTQNIIEQHLKFIHPGGQLLLLLPNFTGLNGWFQKTFDKSNYDKHYIPSMNPNLLANICQKLGLMNIEAGFLGKFGLWLEKENEKSSFARFLKKTIWFLGKVFFKIFPIESKLFSPYIVVKATMPLSK